MFVLDVKIVNDSKGRISVFVRLEAPQQRYSASARAIEVLFEHHVV